MQESCELAAIANTVVSKLAAHQPLPESLISRATPDRAEWLLTYVSQHFGTQTARRNVTKWPDVGRIVTDTTAGRRTPGRTAFASLLLTVDLKQGRLNRHRDPRIRFAGIQDFASPCQLSRIEELLAGKGRYEFEDHIISAYFFRKLKHPWDVLNIFPLNHIHN